MPESNPYQLEESLEDAKVEIVKLNEYIDSLEDSLNDARLQIKRLVDILKDVQDLVN
jgi:hypothetical protein